MLYENPWTRAADKIIEVEALKAAAKEAMDAAKAAQKEVKDCEKEMEEEEWAAMNAKKAMKKTKNAKKVDEVPAIEDKKVTNCCGGFFR